MNVTVVVNGARMAESTNINVAIQRRHMAQEDNSGKTVDGDPLIHPQVITRLISYQRHLKKIIDFNGDVSVDISEIIKDVNEILFSQTVNRF